MGKQKIANSPDLLDYLLDENLPIKERLAKYNEYDCLAFVRSPKCLYPGFNDLFKDNKQYQQEFEKAKEKAIDTIYKKQRELSDEGFLRYLFFELGRTNDHYGSQSITTFDARDKDEPFVYNIAPLNDKVKAEIFEKVAVEHIKTTDGKGIGSNGAVSLGENSKAIIIGYNSLETLKKRLNDALNQPFAEKPNVIERFHNSYIEPLKNTNTSSRLHNIYKALKSGTPESHLHSHYYAYYTDKAKVIELLKFEEYLKSLTKNEPQPLHKQNPENEVVPPQQKELSLKNNEQVATIELENCIHLIGYWINEDKAVIDKILDSEINLSKSFIEPFKKELNTNLIIKNTFEAKKDLLKYYVFEFFELQGFYKVYYEILFTGCLRNYTPLNYEHTNEEGTVKKLNEFENYVVNSWELYNMLFDEIQLCCIKYEIDFFRLCKELNFPTEYLDCGITLSFETMQRKNFPPQQKESDRSDKVEKLKSIWLVEPKLKAEDFLKNGKEKGFWNDLLELTVQRSSSTYGTGKTFLGNIFIAFKGWAIHEHYDYKEAGKVFCEVFNIKIKESTKEPYKAFSSGNGKQIAELKRTFGVK